MEIRTARKPGDKGTQALMQKYGERLVCMVSSFLAPHDGCRRRTSRNVSTICAGVVFGECQGRRERSVSPAGPWRDSVRFHLFPVLRDRPYRSQSSVMFMVSRR